MQEELKDFIKNKKVEYEKYGYAECPAFDSERVYFTNAGFRHLLHKEGVVRSIEQQKRRIELVSNAKEILLSNKNYLTYRESSKGVFKKTSAQFWSFAKVINGNKITVIVRQIDSSSKHFFSIFDEKIL